MNLVLARYRAAAALTFTLMLCSLDANARSPSASYSPSATVSLSGAPQTTAVVGSAYGFQPTISGTTRSVRYFVVNRPAWLSLDRYSGRLSGTPQTSDVGTYSDIRVYAYSWKGSASLPAFAITVTKSTAQPTNAAPVINGIPATTGSAGRAYSFTPSATDADGDKLTFAIQNPPSWATFSSTTGMLSGTPSSAGQASNIVISVTDGKVTTKLAPFTITVSPTILGSATVIWNAPTTNADGTPLTDLAGFRVLYGTDPNQLAQTLEIPGAQQRSVSVEDLQPATYYFAVKAYTASAQESPASAVVWKTIQ